MTHDTIARHLKLARTTVTRILNNDPTYRASQRTRAKVMALAQQMGYDFSNLRRIHRRRHERRSIAIEARIRLLLDDGQVFDQGHCVIRNISIAGAMLGDLELSRGALPLAHATVQLEASQGPLAGFLLSAEIARYAYNNSAELGVSFNGLDNETLTKLEGILVAMRGQAEDEKAHDPKTGGGTT